MRGAGRGFILTPLYRPEPPKFPYLRTATENDDTIFSPVAVEETIGKLLLAWLEKPWRAMLTLAISALILISVWLLRPTWYNILVKERVAGIAVLVAIVCISGLLTYPLEFIFNTVNGWGVKRKAARMKIVEARIIPDSISSLSREEKTFIKASFYLPSCRFINLSADGTVTAGLVMKKILIREENGPYICFTIPDSIWLCLHAQPELLEGDAVELPS